MDFYSWYYRDNGNCIVEDSNLTLEEHDKRFHPEGYKEGDVCSLRDTANKQDLLSPKNVDTTLSIIKNWLPGVSVVEDENYDSLQESLGHNIREYIKVSDWEHWQEVLENYKNGQLFDCYGLNSGNKYDDEPTVERQDGTTVKTEPTIRIYYKVLTRVPDVIKSCFYKIGFPKGSLDTPNSIVRICRRAIAKSVDQSSEMKEWYNSSPNAQSVRRRYIKGIGQYGEHTHGISLSEGFGNLPFVLDNPIAVIRANTGQKNGNSTLLIVTNTEDEDPSKLFVQNGVQQLNDSGEKRHQYSVVAVNIDSKDPSKIDIDSIYGRSALEIQQFIKDGMLMYVNRNLTYKVKDQLGGVRFGKNENMKVGLENITQQNTPQGVISRMSKFDDYKVSTSQPAVHKVANESAFPNRTDFGRVMDDLAYAIHYGDWTVARRSMNGIAETKGYSYDSKLNRYVNQNGHSVSADFEVWDDHGDFTKDFTKRFDKEQLPSSTRCKIIHKGDEPVGWYDRDSGDVHLIKWKADPETIAHELGWHASFHYAEKNNPTLYAKMMEYAKFAPEEIKQSVRNVYGKDLTEEELLDEVGARRFTEENLDPLLNEIQRRNARGWFGKVSDGVKSIYRGFIARIGGNRINTAKLVQMSPEDCMAELAKSMVEGKTLSIVHIGDKNNN